VEAAAQVEAHPARGQRRARRLHRPAYRAALRAQETIHLELAAIQREDAREGLRVRHGLEMGCGVDQREIGERGHGRSVEIARVEETLGGELGHHALRPIEGKPVLTLVIVCIGLLVIFNSLAGWLYSYVIQPFPSPFPRTPIRVGKVVFGQHDLGVIGVTLVLLCLLYAFFRFTSLGLAMRAAAQNPASSRLCGIRVGWMLALGWGLAALVGSVAGMLVAPVIFLEPNMMGGILIYAFASATLGGITSPLGAVVGGFLVGVIENLAGTFIPFIGTELKLTVALLIIVSVLLIRPSGLFGHAVVRRV